MNKIFFLKIDLNCLSIHVFFHDLKGQFGLEFLFDWTILFIIIYSNNSELLEHFDYLQFKSLGMKLTSNGVGMIAKFLNNW